MTKSASLAMFRKVASLEEQMIRASMPKTSAVDVEPLAPFAGQAVTVVVANRGTSRLVKSTPLTFTIGEVVRG